MTECGEIWTKQMTLVIKLYVYRKANKVDVGVSVEAVIL